MNKRKKYCRRCKKREIAKNSRLCSYCLNTRTCTRCKKILSKDKFDDGKHRCIECTKKVNLKLCITCKEYLDKKEFNGTNKKCNKCHEKLHKTKNTKCKSCGKIKNRDEFDYMMRTCNECLEKNEDEVKIKRRRINGLKHCRYCDVITEAKNRVCNNCRNKKKCVRCKQRLEFKKFDDNKIVCKECSKKKKEKIRKENEAKHIVEVVCDKCEKKEIVTRRFRDKPKIHICKECIEKKNDINGKLTKCWFCKKEYVLISSQHIKKCTGDKVDYQQYINKYGKYDGEYCIYSEKYVNIMNIVKKNKITRIIKILITELKKLDIYYEIEHQVAFHHIDIGLPQYTIAIEADGDYWHGNPKFYKVLSKNQKEKQKRDRSKDTFLINRGWIVLRFWENDIINKTNECMIKILNAIEERKCLTKVA